MRQVWYGRMLPIQDQHRTRHERNVLGHPPRDSHARFSLLRGVDEFLRVVLSSGYYTYSLSQSQYADRSSPDALPSPLHSPVGGVQGGAELPAVQVQLQLPLLPPAAGWDNCGLPGMLLPTYLVKVVFF